VTLNIRATQSNGVDAQAGGNTAGADTTVADTVAADTASAKPAVPRAGRPLVGEVVDELSSWNPREFISAFQRWHQGEMSLTHLNVLTLLEAMGPQSMGRLAESLDVSEASMTGIIDRMEKRELVVRQRDGADRRVVLVVPAKGGAKVFEDLNARRRGALAKLLSGLTDEQLEGLLQGHRALRAARQALATEMERDNAKATTGAASGGAGATVNAAGTPGEATK